MSKIKNIILSVILSICIVAPSMPVELLAQEPMELNEDVIVQESEKAPETEEVNNETVTDEFEEASDKTQYEIVSFTELPEEVTQQNVAIGTPVGDLQLPDSLEVSYISEVTTSEDSNQQEKDKPDTETEEESGEEAESEAAY